MLNQKQKSIGRELERVVMKGGKVREDAQLAMREVARMEVELRTERGKSSAALSRVKMMRGDVKRLRINAKREKDRRLKLQSRSYDKVQTPILLSLRYSFIFITFYSFNVYLSQYPRSKWPTYFLSYVEELEEHLVDVEENVGAPPSLLNDSSSKLNLNGSCISESNDAIDLRSVWGRKGEAYSQDAVEYGMEIMHHG